jgi:shikimate dehydrogenase
MIPITGASTVAGVVGRPVRHSLSPVLHNAWLRRAEIDAVYVALSPTEQGFSAFVESLRGGALRGLNVTLPFKEAALAAADDASPLAKAAGAANLLLFHEDGRIEARNTDGAGLLYAFAQQAPDLMLAQQPVLIIGAGGAARGAVATLIDAGVRDVRILNRTLSRAEAIAADFRGVSAFGFDAMAKAIAGSGVVINATSAEVGGQGLHFDFAALPSQAVVMDMLYRPLETRFLLQARSHDLRTVDGLDMLIGQAIPSFEAFFDRSPPADLDARALLLDILERDA